MRDKTYIVFEYILSEDADPANTAVISHVCNEEEMWTWVREVFRTIYDVKGKRTRIAIHELGELRLNLT